MAVHSIEYINDSRLHWWNASQLKSILERLEVGAPATLLDVGVGGGHWGALLGSLLPDGIDICGIDIEQHWVDESLSLFRKVAPQHSYTSMIGDIHSLPLEDASFDLVTCQTVLMHCGNAGQAVGEMARVLKPGGLLLVSEPMNQVNKALMSEGLASKLASESSLLWKVWRSYHEARRNSGLGDHNIAARMPTVFTQQRIELVGAFASEQVNILDHADIDETEILGEIGKVENQALMIDGGITSREIELATESVRSIVNNLKVQRGGIASAVPLIVFAGRRL